MELRDEPEFYIASRLRGIPLVTELEQSTSPRPKRLNSNSGRQISVVINGKRGQIISSNLAKPTKNTNEQLDGKTLRDLMMKEVEKRQVDEPVSLLFKPSASTASVMSRKSRSTTTTNKPKSYNAITTRRIIQHQSNPRQQTNSSTSSTTSITTTTTSTTSTTTSTTRLPQSTITKKTGGFREDRANMKDEKHASPLTTRQAPDYQQRTHQASGNSRHSMNRIQEPSAGRNWILFNKADGSFSMFELAVLISNVAIVGTIIFVILFTWIKAINKKRESKSALNGADTESKLTNVDSTSARFSSAADGMSAGHPSAGNTPAPSRVSIISDAKAKSLTDEPCSLPAKKNHMLAKDELPIDRAASEASTLHPRVPPIISRHEPNDSEVQKVNVRDFNSNSNPSKEEPKIKPNITNQMNAAQTGNKAMAIVQPTENQNVASKETTEVVNLTTIDETTNKMNKPMRTSENKGSAKGHSPVEPKGAVCSPKKNPKADHGGALLSPADSLQSIELPENLVQSIKRVDQPVTSGLPICSELKPSPNMLLDESDSPVYVTDQRVNQTNQSATADVLNRFAKEVKEEANKIMTIEAQIEEPPNSIKSTMKPPTIASKSIKNQNSTMVKSESLNQQQQKNDRSDNIAKERPQNPTGRDSVNERGGNPKGTLESSGQRKSSTIISNNESRIKNHQVVINKLDKRKTQLEIVDIRDDSVTGKMGNKLEKDDTQPTSPSNDDLGQHWISMDGVAVTQSSTGQKQSSGSKQGEGMQTVQNGHLQQDTKALTGLNQAVSEGQIMSPSEIIGNRFSVDYRAQAGSQQQNGSSMSKKNDSIEDGAVNIDTEVEADNQMKNRKYFVYIVHDGHFSAKKECIARIELPAKRRISLADVRQLIANSPDISLNSLRRNRFKFVTETYRLLNEDEDAAVLHQVYPTQGVFLKLNVADQPESLSFPAQRGRSRLSSSNISNSGLQQQISSSSYTQAATRASMARQRRPLRSTTSDSSQLPAIQLNDRSTSLMKTNNRPRGRSSGPATRNQLSLGARSKSGLDSRSLANRNNNMLKGGEKVKNKSLSSTALGRFIDEKVPLPESSRPGGRGVQLNSQPPRPPVKTTTSSSSFGTDMISGAKKLFNAIVT